MININKTSLQNITLFELNILRFLCANMWYCILLHGIMWYCVVLYKVLNSICFVGYCMVFYGSVRYYMIRYGRAYCMYMIIYISYTLQGALKSPLQS